VSKRGEYALPHGKYGSKRRTIMPGVGEILEKFYAAVLKRDLANARGYLNDDLVFVGLFETYRSADEYIAALTGLLSVRCALT
jgi:hypothetical protein